MFLIYEESTFKGEENAKVIETQHFQINGTNLPNYPY